MRMYDIINKKKYGKELSTEEINYLINEYTAGNIPDYQVSALLMAICFNGMNTKETVDLTMAMAHSGDMLDLSAINGIVADKHSTGGVGDKTSLIIGPMVAALGIPIAKMSGRGLGHTGGTIDKLESIPGFNTSLDSKTFFDNVNRMKLAIAGQTADLAPADKKLYALRDVTATVDSIPLIASSIMSKKLASGSKVIVLDITCGNGAFMKNEEDATRLAETMVKIGNSTNRKTYGVITDMNQPLGYAVGNTLEVIEAIETLNNNGPMDLLDVSLTLAAYMVYGTGHAKTIKEAEEMLLETIENGSALKKMAEFVEAQGGDPSYVYDITKFKKASIIEPVYAEKEGFISEINTIEIGMTNLILGGGRETKESIIDNTVGIIFEKKTNSYVKKGDVIAYIHANDEDKLSTALSRFKNAITISDSAGKQLKHIYGVIEE